MIDVIPDGNETASLRFPQISYLGHPGIFPSKFSLNLYTSPLKGLFRVFYRDVLRKQTTN